MLVKLGLLTDVGRAMLNGRAVRRYRLACLGFESLTEADRQLAWRARQAHHDMAQVHTTCMPPRHDMTRHAPRRGAR